MKEEAGATNDVSTESGEVHILLYIITRNVKHSVLLDSTVLRMGVLLSS